MSDASRIDQIRERLKFSSPGPWGFAMTLVGGDPDCNRRQLYNENGSLDLYMNYHMGTWTEQHKADAIFISNARSDIEYLLGKIHE